MKKLFLLALTFTLSFGALTLASCGDGNTAPQSSSTAPASESSSKNSSFPISESETSLSQSSSAQ